MKFSDVRIGEKFFHPKSGESYLKVSNSTASIIIGNGRAFGYINECFNFSPEHGIKLQTERLYTRRDTMRPSYWRLCWSNPDSDSFTYAEGECSAIYYKTMKESIQGGITRFGETAEKAKF